MTEKDIFTVLQTDECVKCLDEIARIHMYTKEYLLLTEELSLDGVMLLQPLKEHRDAYDHLMRIFYIPHRDDFNNLESKYIVENLKKALGHEYRAFFDMADWLTYTCRKYIREMLSSSLVYKRYSKHYDDFDDVKKFINELPFKIAKYRDKKDISHINSLLLEVKQYKKTMDKLLELYRKVQDL